MHCNSVALQYVADYTLGDWVNEIAGKNWSTDNNSEEYEHYLHIYSGMMSVPNQSEVDENNDGVNVFYEDVFNQINIKANAIKQDIEKYTNERYFGTSLIKEIRQRYQKYMIGSMVYARNDNDEFDLCNGYTWKATNPVENDIVDERILQVANYSNEHNVNYLLVQIPSRISYSGKEVPLGANEYTNFNLDKKSEVLTEQRFNYYDMRMDMYHEGWNPQDGYFATDPHWTPESGLLAARLIASYLNDNYDYSFDLTLFDKSNYVKEVYELNSLENKEEVIIYFPKFTNKMTFCNFEGGYEYSGSFEESVFDQSMLDPTFKKSVLDIYSGCRIRNTKLGMIETDSPINDKVILFDISSMSWYTVSYLALQTKQSFFTTGVTPEQLEYLIETIKPDMVISI